MSSHTPSVSVVMPVFNHEKYVAEAISSALGQTFGDFELIIVDDGSVDRSREVIRYFSDARIRFLPQENQGPSVAANTGILAARGKYVAFLCGDDAWLPDRLEKQHAFLTRSEHRMVFSWVELIDDDGRIIEGPQPARDKFDQRTSSRANVLRSYFFNTTHLSAVTGLYDRQILFDAGLFPLSSIQAQDFELLVRLATTHDAPILPERLVKYRIRANGGNLSSARHEQRTWFELYQIYRRFFDETPKELFREAFMDELVRKDFSSDLDYQIEKALIYLRHPSSLIRTLGNEKLFSLLDDEENLRLATERYGLTLPRLYELSALADLNGAIQIAELRAWCNQLTEAKTFYVEEINAAQRTMEGLRQEVQQKDHTIEEQSWKMETARDTVEYQRREIALLQAERDRLFEALRSVERDRGGERALLQHALDLAQQTARRDHEELVLSEDHVRRLLASRAYRAGRVLGAPLRFARKSASKVLGGARTLKEKAKQPSKELMHRVAESARTARENVFHVNMPWPRNRPLVSVVIPCFNYGQFIESAVDSIKHQTFRDVEIIVVEGGSTDGTTRAIIERLPDDVVKIFQDKPHMVGANRNRGIQQARGKYIVCFDADDLLDPSYLEKAVFIAEAGGYDIVHPSVQCFGDSSILWRSRDATFEGVAEFNAIATTALFRRRLWKRAGGYQDFGLGAEHVPEDWDFWIRLLGHGARAKPMSEALMLYRTHSSGLWSKVSMPIEEQRSRIRARAPRLFAPENLERLAKIGQRRHVVVQPLLNLRRVRSASSTTFVFMPPLNAPGEVQIALEVMAALRDAGLAVVAISDYDVDIEAPELGRVRDRIRVLTPQWFNLPTFLPRELWKAFCEHLVASRAPRHILGLGAGALCALTRLAFEGAVPQPSIFERLSYGEKNLLSSLAIPTRKKDARLRVMLCVPWLDRGGAAILMTDIFAKLRKDVELIVVASNPTKCLHGEAPELFNAVSDFVFQLDDSAPEAQKLDALLFLVHRFAPEALLVVGSSLAYQALPLIKQRAPATRVLDQLFNPVGHVESNLRHSAFIDHNVCASEEVTGALSRGGVSTQKMTVVPHGIDTGRFAPERLLSSVPLKDRKRPLRLGFFGRFADEKQPLQVAKLARELPELQFVLAGRGPLKAAVEEYIGTHGLLNCRVIGEVDDPLEYYQQVDVHLITSTIEGLPLTLLEAMALERVVIATPVGHIPSVLRHGENGFIHPCGDLAALVKVVKSICDMPESRRREIGVSARETVVAHHSLESCAATYRQLLLDVPDVAPHKDAAKWSA